jgi:hypothetical protein
LALTEHEARYLDLPQAQLALDLAVKKESADGRTSFSILFSSWRRFLAVAAVIAGLIPVIELNLSAFDYLQKRRELREILDSAEKLIAIDALPDADAQLTRARALDPSSLRLLELEALLALEETLRESQDARSLASIEIQYRKILPQSARASYLLGTAWIGADLDRAQDLLDQASMLNSGVSPTLDVKIHSGKIWLASRRYGLDQNEEWLARADEDFEKAEALIADHPGRAWDAVQIALLSNYSFIEEHRARAGDEAARAEAIEYSKRAFQLALNEGRHLLIGKTAASLSEKLKDIGDLPRAKALNRYAVENSRLAADDRGLYHTTYTQGQLAFNSGDYENAENAYATSQAGALKHADVRMQTFNLLNRAKVAALQSKVE